MNKIGLFVKKKQTKTKQPNQTEFQKLNIITSSIAELSDYFDLSDANKLATVNSHSSKSKKPLTWATKQELHVFRSSVSW